MFCRKHNIHKRLARWESPDVFPEEKAKFRREVIIDAMQQVGPSIFFSLAIITIAFMPLFVLEATEGRLFKPLGNSWDSILKPSVA